MGRGGPVSFRSCLRCSRGDEKGLKKRLPIVMCQLLRCSVGSRLTMHCKETRRIRVFQGTKEGTKRFFTHGVLGLGRPLSRFINRLRGGVTRVGVKMLHVRSMSRRDKRVVLAISRSTSYSKLPILNRAIYGCSRKFVSKVLSLCSKGRCMTIRASY